MWDVCQQAQKKLPPNIKIIRENPDYEEILRQVREVQPLHIITGSEFGVMLTVRLAHDFGLPSNPIESLPAMTQKDAMHEAYYAETVNELKIGHSRLIRYAFEVTDAIGIKYGPVHGEYMIDEKGPVLIEVNCRPMGFGLPRKFMDITFGQHETDSALDAYLDPKGFALKKQELYSPLRKAAVKFFILPEDTPVETAPVLSISRRLKSFYAGSFDRVGRETVLSRTRDMETTGGVLYLTHDDEKILKRELELLHTLEMKYPRILFHDLQPEKQTPAEGFDLQKVMDQTVCHGATLVFSDKLTQAEGVIVTGIDNLPDIYDGFDQGILDLREDKSFVDLESLLQQIFTFFGKVRQGGRIIVPETTYCRLPYGLEGMEILAKIGGLRVAAPPSGKFALLVATVI